MSKFSFADEIIQRQTFLPPFVSMHYITRADITGGTILQLIGAKSSGKTSFALQIIAANQGTLKPVKIGDRQAVAAFVDLERSFDPHYAKLLGIDLSKLLLLKPNSAEDGMNQVEQLLKLGLQCIVWDSVPAAVTKDEFDKTLEDAPKMASSANLLSRWLIRLLPLVDSADCLFIFINQWRKNFSTMAKTDKKPYGPEALGYYSKIILEFTRVKNERDAGISVVEILASKNKFAAEGGRAQVTLRHGEGFARLLDIFNIAVDLGIVKRAGAWYSYQEQRAQGSENALVTFDMKVMEADVRKALTDGT